MTRIIEACIIIKIGGINLLTDAIALIFFENFNIQLQAGESLQDAISNIARRMNIAEIISIAEDINNGNTLSGAMNKIQCFPKHTLRCIEIGEYYGSLDSVIETVTSYYKRKIDTKKKISNAIVEPLTSMMFTSIILGLVMFNVVPIFGDIYKQIALSGAEMLNALISVVTVIGIISFTASMFMMVALLSIMLIWKFGNERLFGFIPFYGKVLEESERIEFLTLFNTLIRNGESYNDALKSCREIVDSKVLLDRIDKCYDLLMNGEYILSSILRESKVMSEDDTKILELGEESGMLCDTFDSILTNLNNKCDRDASRRRKNMSVTLTVFGYTVTCVVVIALILPLIEVLQII